MEQLVAQELKNKLTITIDTRLHLGINSGTIGKEKKSKKHIEQMENFYAISHRLTHFAQIGAQFTQKPAHGQWNDKTKPAFGFHVLILWCILSGVEWTSNYIHTDIFSDDCILLYLDWSKIKENFRLIIEGNLQHPRRCPQSSVGLNNNDCGSAQHVYTFFHLSNQLAKTPITISLNNVVLSIQNNRLPKNLGMTLDKIQTLKQFLTNTAGKLKTRINKIQKLTTTMWGTKAKYILLLGKNHFTYSVGSYTC